MTQILLPRPLRTAAEQSPLSARPAALESCLLVRTMPPGSGVEHLTERLADDLADSGVRTDVVQRENFLVDDPAERAMLADSGADGIVMIVGPSTTILSVAVQTAAHLEIAGRPSVLVVPKELSTQLEYELDHAPVRVRALVHTGGGAPADAVIEALTSPAFPTDSRTASRGTTEEIAGTDDFDRLVAERHWSDGLPMVTPTASRVEAVLTGTSRDPDDVVASYVPPVGEAFTVRDVAIVATMAGAGPAQLPVILAAASAFGTPALDSMTRSVNSFGFAQFVSGPAAVAAGLNGGLAALSPGCEANATIGRALGLIARVLGGARAGATVSPAQGTLAAWPFAFTENTEDSPWAPHHVDRGASPEESYLTLYSGGQAHLGNFYYDDLDEIARAMTSVDLFSGALVLLTPKRAKELASRGMSRQDVIEHLQERASIPLGRFRASGFYPLRSSQIRAGGPLVWPSDYLTDPDDRLVPAFPPGGIDVAVVGSPLSSLAQVWFMRPAGTVRIDDWR